MLIRSFRIASHIPILPWWLAVFLFQLCGHMIVAEPLKRLPELSGYTMGTTYSIKIVEKDTKANSRLPEIHGKIESALRDINQEMSTYISNSTLSQFNNNKAVNQWIPVSKDMVNLVLKAREISDATGGAFDITVGPLVNLWGFGPPGRSLKVPENEQLLNAMQKTGYDQLEAQEEPPALRKKKASLYVDLSGIAKGYGVDRVSEILESHNLRNYMVEIGGEIRTGGLKGSVPWSTTAAATITVHAAVAGCIHGSHVAGKGQFHFFQTAIIDTAGPCGLKGGVIQGQLGLVDQGKLDDRQNKHEHDRYDDQKLHHGLGRYFRHAGFKILCRH